MPQVGPRVVRPPACGLQVVAQRRTHGGLDEDLSLGQHAATWIDDVGSHPRRPAVGARCKGEPQQVRAVEQADRHEGIVVPPDPQRSGRGVRIEAPVPADVSRVELEPVVALPVPQLPQHLGYSGHRRDLQVHAQHPTAPLPRCHVEIRVRSPACSRRAARLRRLQQRCYNSAVTTDPTRRPGRWDDLFALLKEMDSAIEELYVRRGVDGMRSRFVRPLIRLSHDGPSTISQLADSLGSTHSATSQTVAAMSRAGLVISEPGADGRTKVVRLTGRARDLVPLLEAEWRATEAVVADLDDELGGAVSELSGRLREALHGRTMTQRLDDQLDQ